MKYGELNLGQIEAIVNKLGGMEGVHRFLRGEMIARELNLLRQINTVATSGAKKFVARDALKDANVGWTDGNFKKLFLDKVEEDVGDATIAVYRLNKDSLDAMIFAELGNRAEVKLVHFFELLKRQSKGENGALLRNGYPNVAYIKGNNGSVWAFFASWRSGLGCWFVSAQSFEVSCGWDAGSQVLSCDS